MLLPYCQRPSFTPIQNHRQNYSFVYSHFYVIIMLFLCYNNNVHRKMDKHFDKYYFALQLNKIGNFLQIYFKEI
jgi:hypothetical protein